MDSTSMEAEDPKRKSTGSNNNGSPAPSRDSRNSTEEAVIASHSCSGRTVLSHNTIEEIPHATHNWSGQMAVSRNPTVPRPSWADMWMGGRRSPLLPGGHSSGSSRHSWRLSFSLSKRRQDGMLPVAGSSAGWKSPFSFSKGRQGVEDQGIGGRRTKIQLLKCLIPCLNKKNRGNTGPIVPLDSREHLSLRKSLLKKQKTRDQ